MSSFPSVKLGRVARIVGGVGFPPSYQGKQTGKYPFLKVSDLSDPCNGDGVVGSVNWVDDIDLEKLKARVAPVGSVVFPKVGAALLGNVRKVLLCPAAMDNNLMAVTPRSDDSRYWMYALACVDLGELSGASPLPYVSESQIREIWVPSPPLDEQRRIADFLDEETNRIDQLVLIRDRQITLIEEKIISGLSEALIPGSCSDPEGKSPFPWLPSLSQDRPLVKLGHICRLQNGITIDNKRKLAGDVVTSPYLRVANVQAGRVDLETVVEVTVSRETAARSTLRRGDVLMTEGGDLDKLGRGAVWHEEIPGCLHQNHIFALRPDPVLLDGEYLSLMTRTVHGRCYFESTGSRTTNLASTNSSKILDFRIPLPSLNRQQELVRKSHGMISGITRMADALQRQIDLLAERKRALITAAVTGEFDVSTASGRGTV